MLPNYITKLLHDIAKREEFFDYTFETESGSNHGDGFLGIMTAIKLVGNRRKNGIIVHETLNLLCKTPPSNSSRRESFQSGRVFAREVYIYSKILPTFVRFQREKGLSESESFLSFPIVYDSLADEENDQYCLIMEDLRPKKFQMWPKQDPIALDHAQLLMKELAKLHAISFALKDQLPDEFAEFKKLNDVFTEIIKIGKLDIFMDQAIDRAAEVITNDAHKKIMQEFKKTYLKMLDDCFTEEATDRFGIISHGDCWNNNFLYQYNENTTKVESICFLDWQLSRYCSPVLDLHYFIFSGTDKLLRDKHYKALMELYYSTMCDSIKKLGSDPAKLFTFVDFQNELQRFGRFPLLTGPMLIQIMLAGPDDIQDIDEYSERLSKGEFPDLIKSYSESTKRTYTQTINNTVSDLVNYGYVK